MPEVKTRFFMFMLLLVAVRSSGQEVVSSSTTIRLADSAKVSVSFFYADQFNDTSPPFPLSKDSKEKQIVIEKPVLLFDAFSGIPYYIIPGEELYLTANDHSIKFLSSFKERNNELNFFAELNAQYPDFFTTNASMRMKQVIRSADYPVVEKFEREKEKKALEFLEKYMIPNPVSDEFYQYAKQFFYYLKQANLFAILSSPAIQVKGWPAFADTGKIADSGSFSCDSCLPDLAYRMGAYHYLQYLVSAKKIDNGHKAGESAHDIIDSVFSGRTKEFLLFITLKEQLKYGTGSDRSHLTEYITHQNENNLLYVEYLKREIEFKKSVSNKKELVSMDQASTSLDALIEGSRGKLVLIDFWASWCIPCRKTMPDTRKLAQAYDQLQVLYISIDERYSDWIKASRVERIDSPAHSFIIADFQRSEIKKKFKIQAIPRYVLIGKTGEVIAADSPHPGSLELKKLIGRYL
ncbi:TlpA family protein disulfide reductase [Terrimonas sp. NA20]|uniref:TlpA family protein disulfide reductase n=1 Tax=Terrimonas ginsenosidimutans TaxID=2908004 RepID=A0ABS9KWL2_9BACT|nr:TlpA disulfide reductase family protein [Terrimonas ginsenosidimutans]MCG2616747.1 TlpA family protein disulfide reductase [Terrimonas ginsenosidimutans]